VEDAVGGRVGTGVQVGSYPSGVGVAVGGGGTSVGAGKGFKAEFGFINKLTKKIHAHRLMTTITPVSKFHIRSELEFFGAEAFVDCLSFRKLS
jgi:hypothetical protein